MSDKSDLITPKWFGPFAAIGMILVLVGAGFAKFTASRVPNPSTGQTYQIFFGRGSYRYLDFWDFVIFQALTIPGMCVFVVFAGILVYNVYVKYWPWRP